jgi:hypothetical protein
MDESDRQFEKHDEPISSTVRGISMDLSLEYENALDSIGINRDRDSNEIDESDSQSEKHAEQRISISLGMVTCDDIEKSQIKL